MLFFKLDISNISIIIKNIIYTYLLKVNIRDIVLLFILSSLMYGCSVKKNTWASRTYQSVNTRFNVYFNAKVSYDEGLKKIAKAHTEDYSNILPMFTISVHENAGSAKSDMNRVIEKSRKAIKLHSIKMKPSRDSKKWSNPEYRLWYNQEEFNPALKDAWMMLAQAEFHKADFIGSVGTFTYIARHYKDDKDLVARCQLWIIRAYAEMGWMYEAEQVMQKFKQDDLKPSSTSFFAAVNADLLLKNRQYKEAIPFVELALKSEKYKPQKQRLNYLLAQLHLKTESNKEAYDAFSEVIKLNPPYEMDFNARIYRAEISKNTSAVRKELNKMLKNPNNKDYHDQIYYILGKTYMQQKDTTKAISLFEESVDKSTRNGFDKALSLITLAELYYNSQNYIKAHPCYDEASKIITAENDSYAHVSKRAETLGELVVEHQVVVLQDSLQYLASLSEDQRLIAINKIIAQLIADEEAAAKADLAKAEEQDDDAGFTPPLGFGQSAGDWYFYNPATMKAGKTEFRKKWGTRKLEDNWRRASKSATLFNEDTATALVQDTTQLQGDTLAAAPQLTDNKTPEYYLQQIPTTPLAIKKSNEEIATALFNMGIIYKDKVEDYPMAIKTFQEFVRRFPGDERVVDAYFQSYMLETKREHTVEADYYRNKLISEFPESKYVEILSQPDYFARMSRMYQEQDSIYALVYAAYNRSDFTSVKKQVGYVKQNYPLSALMPKFMFLEALSIGKSESTVRLEQSLTKLVEAYPESDVTAMSKDILALMLQGKEATTGSSHGSLLSKRDELVSSEEMEDAAQEFSQDKDSKHRLLLITNADAEGINKIMFNIAAYNFSRFMVKDFDLIVSPIDSTYNSISITNFDSYDEADWYVGSIANDPSLVALSAEHAIEKHIISEENYGMMKSIFSLDQYIAFAASNLKSTRSSDEGLLIATQVKEVKEIEAQTEAQTEATVEEQTGSPVLDNNVAEQAGTQQTETSRQQKDEPQVEEPVILYKNLYAHKPNDPHYVAIAVLKGDFDFEKLKADFNAYNSKEYPVLNLKISLEKVGTMQVMIVGSFGDANIAKSYLFRMASASQLYASLKGTDYRNLMGTQRNLNTMMQKDAMTIYFEFMKEYYLK